MTELLLLAVLATFRLAIDVATQDGPGNLYARLRGMVQQRFGASHWVTEGVNCPICVSFWVALLATLAAWPWLALPLPLFPLVWLGVAGGALAIIWRR